MGPPTRKSSRIRQSNSSNLEPVIVKTCSPDKTPTRGRRTFKNKKSPCMDEELKSSSKKIKILPNISMNEDRNGTSAEKVTKEEPSPSTSELDDFDAFIPQKPKISTLKRQKKNQNTPSCSKNSDDSGFNSNADVESNSCSQITTPIKPKILEKDASTMDVAELLALGEGTITEESKIDDSESEEDWEEVGEKKHQIPKEGVDITLEVSDLKQKKKKCSHVDIKEEIRKRMNRVRRDMQMRVHQSHLLCWIAHLRFVNNILNSSCLRGIALSISGNGPQLPKKITIKHLEKFLKWFSDEFSLQESQDDGSLLVQLMKQLESRCVTSTRFLVYIFVCFLRMLGLEARLVVSLNVLPLKPDNKLIIDEKKKIKIKEVVKKKKEEPKKKKKILKINSSDEESEKEKPKRKRQAKTIATKKAKKIVSTESSNDDDFISDDEKKKKTPKQKQIKKKDVTPKEESDSDKDFKPESLKRKKIIDRRVLSSDDEEEISVKKEARKKKGVDIWAEVYVEKKWISVDVSRYKVNCPQDLFSRASQPVLYVIACNNDDTMKDVTQRYVPNWHSETRKQRVDAEWWEETMFPYQPVNKKKDEQEDEDILKLLSDKPLPTSITQYKNHPLYVLKRHLLKYEAIYPVDAPTFGFVRGEPVYARECVHLLRSRENWYHKEARVVKPKETPYKIVTTTRYDKVNYKFYRAPLDLFGEWQTELYVAPPAVDGKVPRNEYGNVELFKPSMLPAGTVHLQNPGLLRLARKLNIDCANAMMGFDFHSGAIHPVFDGVVVCEEFKDQLLEAWEIEVEESAKRSEMKREKRIYGNWRRLIRGLLIREKLKLKYAFGENSEEEEEEEDEEEEVPLVEIQKKSLKKRVLK